jgi:hypothetical protein
LNTTKKKKKNPTPHNNVQWRNEKIKNILKKKKTGNGISRFSHKKKNIINDTLNII